MRIDYFKLYDTQDNCQVENDYNEKWVKMTSGEAFDIALKATPENTNRLRLKSVISVKDGKYYLAHYTGGLNGCGEWSNYLSDIQKLFTNLNKAWLVDMINDCPDDVFDFVVGFRINKNANEE